MKAFFKQNIAILLILLIGLILRLYKIGFLNPWLDELSTLQVSDPDLTFSETHQLIMTREGFPHFYFLSLKYLSSIFGHSILLLRLFSVLFGMLSIFYLYKLAKELFNKNIGLIAACLMAVNGFHIYHSQEARTYSLLVFFVIFASYQLIKYIKNPVWSNTLLLGVSIGLISNAHPLGILNVGVIYFTLLVFLYLSNDKVLIFKQLSLVSIISLIVFLPVFQIILRVSNISSFWIPDASLEIIKIAFLELLGDNIIIFYIYLVSIVILFISLFYRLKNSKNEEERKLNKIWILMFLIWIIVNVGVIIIKSYIGISIILNRYFIGFLPLFFISLAYVLDLIKNKLAVKILVACFAFYSLYFIIVEKQYYSRVSKTEWQSLANEIISNNSKNHRIYSTYGFTSNILFKGTPSYKLLKEILFDDYIKSVRLNTIERESFWYFDGNFRPFSLKEENLKFLEENYTLAKEIQKYDCWARHYIVKPTQMNDEQSNSSKLSLKDFSPTIIGDDGAVYMFENSEIASKSLQLEKGKYQLIIKGNSFPREPINGENAHIVIKMDQAIYQSFYLSEKDNESENIFEFTVDEPKKVIFSIMFDNDITIGKKDRNVVLNEIILKAMETN